MQKIELEVSNDIVDKVLFFLTNLPKDKIKVNKNNKQVQSENLFDDFLSQPYKIDKFQKYSRDRLHER